MGALDTMAEATLVNCAASGDVSIGSQYGGGILGFGNSNFSVTAENCYFSGSISGSKRYGFAYVSKYASGGTIDLTNSYYDNEKNKGTSSWSPFESTPSESNCNLAGDETLTGIGTADFTTLAADLGDAFVDGATAPLLMWAEDLAEDGRSLTIIAADAATVTLARDGVADESYEMLQDGEAFTADNLSSGIYTYTATSAASDKGTGRGKVVVGKIDNEKTIVLPEKALETQIVVTPGYAEVALYLGDVETGERQDADTVENGIYTYQLNKGTYAYVATAFGYTEATGTITVPLAAGEGEIVLDPLPTTEVVFQIACGEETPSVQVWHDDLLMPATEEHALTYDLPDGDYTYEVAAPGYLGQKGSFTVPTDININLELTSNDVWDGTTAHSLVGAGTAESPYLISHGRELALLAERVNNGDSSYVNAYVELTQDIDLGHVSWTPIGSASVRPFKGYFDGKGFTIHNLNVEETYAYYGLFGCLTDATVENFTITGEVYCPEPYGLVGGLSGYATGDVTIRNCANLANISALARGNGGTGGLIGGYDDGVEYKWLNKRLLLENCYNAGLVVSTGSDTNTTIGGLVGGNKNCVQLVNCYNVGVVYGPGVQAAGLLGNGGYQTGDDCYPSFTNCYNAGPVTGATEKEYALYAKGTVAQSRITHSYALEDSAAMQHKGVTIVTADELRGLAATLGEAWAQEEGKNNGYPYLLAVEPVLLDTTLKDEADKYCDVVAAPASVHVGDSLTLLLAGAQADPTVTVTCIQTADDIQSGYLDCQGDVISLRQSNHTMEAVTETATLQFANEYGRFRKPISVVIYPAASMADTLLENIAKTYREDSNDWVVFDMAAYAALNPDAPYVTSEAAKQNYLNLTLNALSKSSALATDRAKAEIILHSLGLDSTELYAFESETPFNNAAKLQNMDLGSSYYAAPWILLADEQGKVELTASQIQRMVGLLTANQGENGLFYSIWGTEKYDDVDTTGTALAAVARFYLADADPYNVKDSVERFVTKALAGLSNAQGSNGSYGNVNSDAMVITGLTALGIDPAQDSRFVKNGCSLADALFLYVNDGNNGFTTSYQSGSQGEKAQALATEQGFRALIALTQFQKDPGVSFNIYSFDVAGSEIPQGPVHADGIGKVDTIPDIPESDANISVGFSVKPSDDSEWLSNTTITVPEGATVYHVFTKALAAADMTSVGAEQNYVKSITKNGVTLSQFDAGPNSGWLYTVNGKLAQKGLQDYVLRQGDQVVFFYTDEWQKQPGTSGWGGGLATAEETTTVSAKLTPVVTLDADGNANVEVTASSIANILAQDELPTQITIAPTGANTANQIKITMMKTSVADIAQEKGMALALETPLADLTLATPALNQLAQQSGDQVTFTFAKQGNDRIGIDIAVDENLVKSLTGGMRLAIPVSNADAATVLVMVDSNGQETVLKKSALWDGTLVAAIDGSCQVKVLQNSKAFADVTESFWGKDAIAFVTSRELFNGVGDNTFSPNSNMTRAMFVTVLYRLEDSPQTTSHSFQDVAADAWYHQAVAWAATTGIVNGVSETTFEPDRAISREELSSMFYRYANICGCDISQTGDLSSFGDSSTIASWAKDGMSWSVGAGLLNGRTNDMLAPQALATRAEVATMLQRFILNLVK